MIERLSKLLNLRPGEWKLVLPLLLLLMINTLVVELAQVVATSGFVSYAGSSQLPWVWIIDMVVLLIFGGVYAQIVDRSKRVHLVGWMLGSFAIVYLVIQLLFGYGVPDQINYFLLLILTDQQFFIFPLAFWALASDIYRVSESKRLFPIIGAGFAFGSIIGNAVAATSASLFVKYGGEAHQLLGFAALLLLVGLGLLYFTFRNREIPGRQSKDNAVNVRESIEVGRDFFNNVPLFRYLAITILLVYLAYTMIQYHFLSVLEQTFQSDLQFQTFYGTYKVGLILATLVFQWLITGRLLEKIGLKSSFVLFPITIMLASGSGLAVPGLIGAAVGVFIIELVERAWDQPVRKSLQGLIPDERRGRITTFMDTYVLALATITASVILLLLTWLTPLLQLSDQVGTAIYLGIAGLAGAGAIWTAVKARSVYDQSMLNWRLSRRQRRGLTGVMNKLDL